MSLTLVTDPEKPSTLSRRTFLQGVSAALGATMTGAASSLLDAQQAVAAVGPTLPSGTPILVLIELNGGNDILNTVIPVNVPFVTGYYRGARPTIGITRVTSTRPYGYPSASDNLPPALDIGHGWGLHGALPYLANRWYNVKDVAIVQGVGENVKREMSHFASFAFHWAGAFGGQLMATGWLGRYNDLANPAQPLGAVSLIGPHDALNAVQSPSVALWSLSNFSYYVNNIPDSTAWLTQMAAMGTLPSSALNKAAVAAKANYDSHQAMATAAGIPAFANGQYAGELGSQLSVVASLIRAGVPCQTYVCGLGGFDHHGNEPADHKMRLGRLDAGLTQFFSQLGGTGRAQDVIVAIYSEFGRQIKGNGSTGTDHGLASSMIVLGNGVKGGFYGTHPSLAPADRYADAMVPNLDFRNVYATLLNRLGGSPALTDSALGRDESGNPFVDIGLWSTGPSIPADEDVSATSDAEGAPAPDPAPSTTSSSTTSTTAPASTTTKPAPTTATTAAPHPGTSTPAPTTTTPSPVPGGGTTTTTDRRM